MNVVVSNIRGDLACWIDIPINLTCKPAQLMKNTFEWFCFLKGEYERRKGTECLGNNKLRKGKKKKEKVKIDNQFWGDPKTYLR